MRISRTSLCTTVLLVLASMPRTAEACVATYLDFNVNTSTNKVDAWAFVEDYYDSECFSGSWGYYEHSYLATVYVVSPTQNYASDGDAQYNVVYGGGSANAFASLSFQDDSGVFDVSFEVNIWCSIVGTLLHVPWGGPLEAPRHAYSEWPTDECGLSPGGLDYSENHPGKDVNASDYGSNVRSMDSGTVTNVFGSGQSGGNANFVVVQGSDGMYTVYAHVTPSVEEEEMVGGGQFIGTVDNTGTTQGPHAHICRSQTPSCSGGVDYNLPDCPL